MNIEEIFDKVEERLNDGTGRAIINHVLAISGKIACAYRNDDGLRCAVGIFLPDNREMLTTFGPVSALIRKFKDHHDFPAFIADNHDLMRDLQSAHDREHHWDGKVFNEQGKKFFKELRVEYLGKED